MEPEILRFAQNDEANAVIPAKAGIQEVAFMKIIPKEEFTIETTLTCDDAVAALSKMVQPRRKWEQWMDGDITSFEGTLSNEGFKVTRIHHSARHSFLPVVSGRFEQGGGGVRIIVNMELFTSARVFLKFVYILFAFMYCAMGVAVVVKGGLNEILPFFLFDTALLVCIYLMVYLFFGIEARKARRIIVDVFEPHQPSTS